MHGEIDLAAGQRTVQLLGPERLAADVRERPVLNPVAAGLHHDDLDRAFIPAMARPQRLHRHMRLPQRERAATGPKAERSGGLFHDTSVFKHLGRRPWMKKE